MQQLEHELEELKQQRKQTPKHIDWDQLPNENKFQRLAPSRKRLIDTVKLIAYRAETALTAIVREQFAREDDAGRWCATYFAARPTYRPTPKPAS